MAAHLSIRNAPEDLIERVKQQAKRHQRSLRGEVLDILDKAVPGREQDLCVDDLFREVRKLGLSGPSESAVLIRADRDAR
ncbi:MAG: FitA-like ribbon-helix-helix domain-containing protein [Niveispirillum sp.]|uniref:FitA-like ribbon-helix-helix domain-containing protein n=1 Tax=Niveispirillum sp. TaxID=1917217 RepID=UPI003BA7E8E4